MGALQWAGTAAAALIAIGTVARWLWLRLTRAARWTSAMVDLPDHVADLSRSVTTLTGSVDRLSAAIETTGPALTLNGTGHRSRISLERL
jgi:hypothetical protein